MKHGDQQAVDEEAGAAADATRRRRCVDARLRAVVAQRAVADGTAGALSSDGTSLRCQVAPGRAFATLSTLARGDAPRDEEVEQAEDHDDEEQHPGDRRRLAEVTAGERHVPQVEHGRLALPVRAADAAGVDGSNSRGSAKICRPPIVEVMIDEDQRRPELGSVIEKNRRNGAGAVDAPPPRRSRAAPPAWRRAG